MPQISTTPHMTSSSAQFIGECPYCEYKCNAKDKRTLTIKIKLHSKICLPPNKMNKYKCSKCNWECSMLDERQFNIIVIQHKKLHDRDRKAELVSHLKRMAFNQLTTKKGKQQAELLMKDDAHVDAVLKQLGIKFDTKNL